MGLVAARSIWAWWRGCGWRLDRPFGLGFFPGFFWASLIDRAIGWGLNKLPAYSESATPFPDRPLPPPDRPLPPPDRPLPPPDRPLPPPDRPHAHGIDRAEWLSYPSEAAIVDRLRG
jgi:hypothetical protein